MYATAVHPEAKAPRKQKKKPWFLKRWAINWVREDWANADENILASNRIESISPRDTHTLDSDRAIKFNIYHANGGRVVEINSYDLHKDRHKRSLYVITSDQDFGREIDKIITMEALK
jgi:hypothetical protein